MTNAKKIFFEIKEGIIPEIPETEREAIAFLILEHYGISKTQFITSALIEFPENQLPEIISRINSGEPIQYILGEARFHGFSFRVNRNVLIPRPETEELVDILLQRFPENSKLEVLDLGTGSGAISVSLACLRSFWHITATDISERALEVARENAEKLDVSERIIFHRSNMLSETLAAENLFDIIVSNPPYIGWDQRKTLASSVADFEPSLALFAPEGDPLAFYRAISKIAENHLRPGGLLALEINADFGKEVVNTFNIGAFDQIELIQDISGKNRFVFAKRRTFL